MHHFGNKIFNIPNLLSLLRLCMIPVIVWLYVREENYSAAAVLLMLSGLTDIADGMIARRCNMVTDFGKAFDPAADKLTQLAVLLCLVTRFTWILLPLVLLAAKEVLTGTMSLLVIRRTGHVPAAVWHGKMTTMLLYTMMILHLFWYEIPNFVSMISVILCSASILVSGVLYALRNLTFLKSE